MAHSFISTLRIEDHSACVWGMTNHFVQNDILGKEDNIWRGYMLGILFLFNYFGRVSLNIGLVVKCLNNLM